MMNLAEIIKNLHHDNWRVRRDAVRALGQWADPRVVFPLISALGDEEWAVRQSAVEALIKIGRPAVEPLINALTSESWRISRKAEEALVGIGKPAVEPLIKMLNCENVGIKTRIISMLGEIGDPEAIMPLIKALEDDFFRPYAAAALGKIRDKRAVPFLIKFNEVTALGEIGDPSAIPFLLTMLKDGSWNNRCLAAEALGKIGNAAVGPLANLIKNKELNDRGLVAAALGKTGAKEAIEPLIQALKDKDPVVRWRSARALSELGHAAVGALVKLLEETDSDIRMRVAEILGKIGDKRAIKPLNELFQNDLREEVKKVAGEALSKLIPERASSLTGNKLELEDVFFLTYPGSGRFFKATIINDIFDFFELKEVNDLIRGETRPPVPIRCRYVGGRLAPEDFVWVEPFFCLISERVRSLLLEHKFTGWRTFPVELYDKFGKLIEGYHGLCVTGRAGPVDISRAPIAVLPSVVPEGEPEIVKQGLYFDENTWDGSDFFCLKDRNDFLITRRVVKALQKARPAIKNWKAEPVSYVRWPLEWEENGFFFLTDDERDEVNRIRQELKEKKREAKRLAAQKLKMENDLPYIPLLHSLVALNCFEEGTMEEAAFLIDKGLGKYDRQTLSWLPERVQEREICTEIIKKFKNEEERAVNLLSHTLQSNGDEKIRAAAAFALGKLNNIKAVDPLLQALHDDIALVRREAVKALGSLCDTRIAEALIDIISLEKAVEVKWVIAQVLGKLRASRVIAPIMEIIEKEDDDDSVRSMFIEALGEIGDSRAVPFLINILQEGGVFAQISAANALGKIGDVRAIFPLIEAFTNEDSNLAASIQYALEKIGVPAVLPLIRSLGHGNRLVRSRAAATLGLIGDQKAVSSLLSLLSTEKDPEVIVSVVQALGQLSDPRAIRALQDIARNSNVDFLKEEARMAIQKLLTKKV